jgi:hypothetical protein
MDADFRQDDELKVIALTLGDYLRTEIPCKSATLVL